MDLKAIERGVRKVRERIRSACDVADRDPEEVTLIGAVKGRNPDEIRALVDAGITDLGHNRAQEYRDTRSAVTDGVRWHFIGGIQSNKVRYLDGLTLIHSVDRTEIVDALERADGSFEVLCEVNVAAEPTKHGVAVEGLEALLRYILSMSTVNARGLMFVAPKAVNPEDVRWAFEKLRRLRDRYTEYGTEELSMGMSSDLEMAIQEGATMVRIGRALFGEE